MKALAKRPSTYADLKTLPEDVTGELLNGEIIATPRPTNLHGRAASVLSAELMGPFDRGRGGPGGWWFIIEPELHLEEDVLVPDLAAWRREKLPQVPDEPFFRLAPDWACEVLSPRTARTDRMVKLPKYAKAGVGYVWLIEPTTRTLETFKLQGKEWLLVASFVGDEKVRAEPFEAVELELGALWLRKTETD